MSSCNGRLPKSVKCSTSIPAVARITCGAAPESANELLPLTKKPLRGASAASMSASLAIEPAPMCSICAMAQILHEPFFVLYRSLGGPRKVLARQQIYFDLQKRRPVLRGERRKPLDKSSGRRCAAGTRVPGGLIEGQI